MNHETASTNLQHVLIKWTGSKRRQARQIVAKFPRKIATYYEPFLGFEIHQPYVELGRLRLNTGREKYLSRVDAWLAEA